MIVIKSMLKVHFAIMTILIRMVTLKQKLKSIKVSFIILLIYYSRLMHYHKIATFKLLNRSRHNNEEDEE
jgi:hypothetical protein